MDAWNDFKLLDLRMAITITPAGGKTQPGVVTAEMQTEVNMDTHTVLLSHPLITGTYFPSLDPASSAKLGQLVESFLPPTAMLTISLDRLVASANKPKPKAVAAVKNDPPAIYFSFKPALLLQLNGQPVKAPVANSQSGVRCELELAALSGQVDLAVLPLRRGGLDDLLHTHLRLEPRPPLCPPRWRRFRRTQTGRI